MRGMEGGPWLILIGLASFAADSRAQRITTVVGNGTFAYTGDGGPATSAGLGGPQGIAFSVSDTMYIADTYSCTIRKIDTAGTISTVAGNRVCGFSGDGGPATSASLSYPVAVAVDSLGNLYIADWSNHRIRKVATNGTISTFAGSGVDGYGGDLGPATNAALSRPVGVAVDAARNVFISDPLHYVVRKVDSDGTITTYAGNGTFFPYGDEHALATNVAVSPWGLAVDASGNLYIADKGFNTIRKVGTGGLISTLVGTGELGFSGDGGSAGDAALAHPSAIAVGRDGNFYITDQDNVRVRRVDYAGIITTVAGTGQQGFSGDGGPATSAQLQIPVGVAVDSKGSFYIDDYGNNRIRKVAGNLIFVNGFEQQN